MKRSSKKVAARRKSRARRLPSKDAALVKALTKRLRWWARMLDKATHS